MSQKISKYLPRPLKQTFRFLFWKGQDHQDALMRIKRMREKLERKGPAIRADQPRRFLFNSQFPWDFSWVEYALATALKLRGHEVKMMACGGLPSYCELETATKKRPSCASCLKKTLGCFDAFGLPYYVGRDFLTTRDQSNARQIAYGMKIEELRNFEINGIPLGKLSWINLFQYYKGYPFEIDMDKEKVFRNCMESSVLLSHITSRLFDTYQPDMVITVNGKFLQWAPFVILARERDIPFLTWEDLNIGIPSRTIFAINEIAHEQNIHAEWEDLKQQPLSDEERKYLYDHFRLWADGKMTRFQYYDHTIIKDVDDIKRRLALRTDAPIVSLFPNVSWDSSSVGFESAFNSMFDWIFKVVEYARIRPDMEFLIRTHPAEKRVPEAFKSSTPVCEEVVERCAPVPPNVKLIDALNPISSYVLGSISDVVMTYTSTLGLEFALRGKRPWVAASAYYTGKGFTIDLKSYQHMYDLLDQNRFDNQLSPAQIDLAERFAYIVRFRRLVLFPYLNMGRFKPPDFDIFLPGGDPVIHNLCDYVLGKRSYLDMGGSQRSGMTVS